MKVALRDDDTCYFTSPETLERVYHDVWDRLPVCLATVPFAIGYERKGIPEEHWHSGVSFPLEQNAALVPFLQAAIGARPRDGRAARVYAPGLSGRLRVPGGAGSGAARRAMDWRYLQRDAGRADLACSCRRTTRCRSAALAAVSGAGLNLLGSFLSFRPSMRPWDAPHAGQLVAGARVSRRRPAVRRSDRFVYPHVLRYAAARGVWLPQPDSGHDRR